jgi:tRNA A-37 threonylcarbamoyl transferase component Bud32
VPPDDLSTTLRNLPRIGTLIKDRGYRQVWRFEYRGRAYFLKFYPRQGLRLGRIFRRSPALREFHRLQWLQKAKIPSARPTAVLFGLRFEDQVGDAVITEAIEPSMRLDEYLNELALRGERAPDHYQLSEQMRSIMQHLIVADLGHADLHLGNFLRTEDGQLHLLDAYELYRGRLRRRDLYFLAHSVSRFATLGDYQRGWNQLGPGGKLPPRNPASPGRWRSFVRKSTGENRYFGRIDSDGWSGHFFKHAAHPRRWSSASRLHVERKDWERAWPLLMQQIESQQLTVLKQSPSGDVLAGEVTLGGHPVEVIVKRPRRRYWHRYINEIGRGVRARRAWRKSWNLIARDIPTAWPLILMERRVLGYVTDAMIVFEQVPGPLLARVHLDELPADDRETLFRRLGRTLKRLERDGLYHWDAKSSNWIVAADEKLGPVPILIDVDGVRRLKALGFGMERILRSMRDHRQYTPEDSLALCRGYLPWAPLAVEAGKAKGDI